MNLRHFAGGMQQHDQKECLHPLYCIPVRQRPMARATTMARRPDLLQLPRSLTQHSQSQVNLKVLRPCCRSALVGQIWNPCEKSTSQTRQQVAAAGPLLPPRRCEPIRKFINIFAHSQQSKSYLALRAPTTAVAMMVAMVQLPNWHLNMFLGSVWKQKKRLPMLVQIKCVKLRNIVIMDLILPHLYWMVARCIQSVMPVLKVGGAAFGMTGWMKLAENSLTAVKQALVQHGPVAVGVEAGYGWNFYSSGTLTQEDCPADANINHAVTLVGYGKEGSNKYWRILNSWGADWGEGGFVRIMRSDTEDDYCGYMGITSETDNDSVKVCGMCGILYDASLPVFAGEGAAAKAAALHSCK